MDPNSAPSTIVHLVHGTWGAGLWPLIRRGLELWLPTAWWFQNRPEKPPAEPHWFEADSDFAHEIRAGLDPSLQDAKFVPFRWSGSNSFRARDQAALEFRQHLRESLAEYPTANHFIVCHSHGGNVAVNAVGSHSDPAEWDQLKGILTLATPFLGRRQEVNPNKLNYLTMAKLMAACVVLSLLWYYASFRKPETLWGVGIVALPFLGATLLPRWTSWRSLSGLPHLAYWAIGLSMVASLGTTFGNLPLESPAEKDQQLGATALLYAIGALLAVLTLVVLILAQWSRSLIAKAEAVGPEDLSRVALQLLFLFVIVASPGILFKLGNLPEAQQDDSLLLLVAGPFVVACFVQYFGLGHHLRRWFKGDLATPWKDPLYNLPCRLLALRLPSDEAALVIALGQIVGRIGEFLFGFALDGFGQSWRIVTFRPTQASAGFKFMVWLWVGGLSLSAIAFAFSQSLSQGFLMLILLPLFASIFLFMAHFFLLVLVFPTWWICATLLAVSVGPDTLLRVPEYAVDCEPLPKCQNPEQAQLIVDWRAAEEYAKWAEQAANRGALRHSIHSLPSVRRHVAGWISTLSTSSTPAS